MSNVWSILRDLGREFSMDQVIATRSLYVPLAPRPDPAELVATRDIPYGPQARHRLDVFQPLGKVAGLPVVVFVHGGGFNQGDKGDADAPFFNNFGVWAVRAGFIGVTMTYRLAPEHVWPAGSRDVSCALRWLADHVETFGGSRRSIVIVGHSAGATHVAGCLIGQGSDAAPVPAVAAAVMVAGMYDINRTNFNPMYEGYYGKESAPLAQFSTLAGLAVLQTPCLYTISEFDPPFFHQHLASLCAERMQVAGQMPQIAWLAGHNHVSAVLQLGCDSDTLGPEIAKFVRRHTA
jgi:acetyl esterase/lipase